MLLDPVRISQMDVPTRQSYTIAVVDPDERSAAAGVTGIARSLGVAASPLIAGPLLLGAAFVGAPFVIARQHQDRLRPAALPVVQQRAAARGAQAGEPLRPRVRLAIEKGGA